MSCTDHQVTLLSTLVLWDTRTRRLIFCHAPALCSMRVMLTFSESVRCSVRCVSCTDHAAALGNVQEMLTLLGLGKRCSVCCVSCTDHAAALGNVQEMLTLVLGWAKDVLCVVCLV